MARYPQQIQSAGTHCALQPLGLLVPSGHTVRLLSNRNTNCVTSVERWNLDETYKGIEFVLRAIDERGSCQMRSVLSWLPHTAARLPGRDQIRPNDRREAATDLLGKASPDERSAQHVSSYAVLHRQEKELRQGVYDGVELGRR